MKEQYEREYEAHERTHTLWLELVRWVGRFSGDVAPHRAVAPEGATGRVACRECGSDPLHPIHSPALRDCLLWPHPQRVSKDEVRYWNGEDPADPRALPYASQTPI